MTPVGRRGLILAPCFCLGCNALFGVDDLDVGPAETSTTMTTTTGSYGGSVEGGGMGGIAGDLGGGGVAGAGGMGGAGGQVPPPVTCTDHYGALPGFELCVEALGTCTFFVELAGDPCIKVCEDAGGACQAAFGNGGPGMQCVPASAVTCGEPFQNAICVCTRGCGGGPPCMPPQVCFNDVCQ